MRFIGRPYSSLLRVSLDCNHLPIVSWNPPFCQPPSFFKFVVISIFFPSVLSVRVRCVLITQLGSTSPAFSIAVLVIIWLREKVYLSLCHSKLVFITLSLKVNLIPLIPPPWGNNFSAVSVILNLSSTLGSSVVLINLDAHQRKK